MPLPDEVTEVTSRFLTAIDERAPGLVQGLYLHGSLALTGEFFPGSDIDFVAVLPARPGGAELDALAAAHEAVRAQRPRPPFEGIHLLRADLAGLGISRLHHLLATGTMTSKSGAGRYALTAFGPRWHPIIREALRARERPQEPSSYEANEPARGQDCTGFTAMALRASQSLTR